MDWLTFVASVIGSLVWPAVAVFLIIILRNQLRALVGRLLRMKWGEFEVGFKEIFEEAREVAEEIREETPPKLAPPEQGVDDNLAELARLNPNGAILEAYGLIGQVISQYADKLPYRRSTTNYMRLLKGKGLINDDAFFLFEKLRQIRNAVVHNLPAVTSLEAREYIDQTRLIRALLAQQLGEKYGPK
jgi:hypothetical protein